MYDYQDERAFVLLDKSLALARIAIAYQEVFRHRSI